MSFDSVLDKEKVGSEKHHSCFQIGTEQACEVASRVSRLSKLMRITDLLVLDDHDLIVSENIEVRVYRRRLSFLVKATMDFLIFHDSCLNNLLRSLNVVIKSKKIDNDRDFFP